MGADITILPISQGAPFRDLREPFGFQALVYRLRNQAHVSRVTAL
jgi:hypothetical protein